MPGAAALSTFQKLPGGGGGGRGSWLGSPSAAVAAPPPLRQLPPSGMVQKPADAKGGTEKVMPSPASVPISACRAAAAATPGSPAQTHRLASHSSGLLRARRARQLPSRAAPSPPRRRLRSGALSPGATPLPGGGSPLLGASVATPLARCRVESPRGGDASRGEREGTELPPLGGRTSRRPTCAAAGGSRAPRSGSRALSPAERGPGEGALWVLRATWRTPYARWAGCPGPRPGTAVAAPQRTRLPARRQLPCIGSGASSFLPLLFHRIAAPSESQRRSGSSSQPLVVSATRLRPPTRLQQPRAWARPWGGRCWEAADWTEHTAPGPQRTCKRG